MKKKAVNLFVIVILILSMCFSVMASIVEQGGGNRSPGELIVCIEDDANLAAVSIDDVTAKVDDLLGFSDFTIKDNLLESTGIANDNMSAYGVNESLKNSIIQNMGYTYLVEYPETKFTFEEAKLKLEGELKKAGYEVKSVEPNYILEAFGTFNEDIDLTDEMSGQAVNPSQKWHYEMIKLPSAWEITTGNSNVRIAILDTGIDHNHGSLKNYVATNLGKNFTSDVTTDTMDRQSHGTHVAGTVASYGNVSGVMQNATLIPVKILGDNGKGTLYGIQQGILYAASQNADVINMSLGGGGYSSSFEAACKTAIQNGVIIVAATGNEYASSISYPAAYDCVIAVGAVDSSRRRASFSNYGDGLDVMAPGASIYSTVPNGCYSFKSGTSMACPHVAGLAGLMRSADKNISVDRVRSMLKETSQPAGNANEYGAGIVDAFAVLQAITGTTPITQVAMPTLSVASGTYTQAQNVSISCATEGVTIRYTTNGTEPTVDSTLYNGTIAISTTTTLKAKAFKNGMKDSQTVSATYVIKDTPDNPDNPTVEPWTNGKAYKTGDVVSYNGKNYICRQGHTSLTGWEPANVPALWSEHSGDIKPIKTVEMPTFSLQEGNYLQAQNVSISCATEGATIRYTTNGTEPSENAILYNGAISITTTTTLKAKAFKDGMNASAVVAATYIIPDNPNNPDNPSEPDDPNMPTINPWSSGTNYKVDEVVSYNGGNYVCRQGHTSLVGWEPTNVPALWSPYTGK